jgi:hypothetical protein
MGSDDRELGCDRDRLLDTLRHGTARSVMLVRAQSRLAITGRTAIQCVSHMDLLEDEDLVLDEDLSLCLRAEFPSRRVDPARLQRAAQGAG